MSDRISGASLVRGRARGRTPQRTRFPSYPVSDGSMAFSGLSVFDRSTNIGETSSLINNQESVTGTVREIAKAAEPGRGGTGSPLYKSRGIRKPTGDVFNGYGTTGVKSENVTTNYLYMSQTHDFHLHQYRVGFAPDENFTQLKKTLLRMKENELPSYIFDGHMLYTTTPIPAEKRELTVTVQGKDNEQFQILIKPVGYVLPDSPMYVQFYNMVMRKCMTLLGIEELGRHFYDRDSAIKIEEEKIQLWHGIITAIRNHDARSVSM